jgi:hypothetical protein
MVEPWHYGMTDFVPAAMYRNIYYISHVSTIGIDAVFILRIFSRPIIGMILVMDQCNPMLISTSMMSVFYSIYLWSQLNINEKMLRGRGILMFYKDMNGIGN